MGRGKKNGSYLDKLAILGSNLGLERIKSLLAALGNPQGELVTVHIAGSNGKGSTAAMVASILTAAGYRVGLYTSPHLNSYRERFQINGQEISAADLNELLAQISQAAQRVTRETDQEHPTEFEVLTAAALQYFNRMQVDLAIMEVGLGGRLDATNVITPLVTIITHIALEHTTVLGNTLAEVAREKAGIIKAGVPVVSSHQDPEVAVVIAEVCRRQGAELSMVGRDIHKGEISLDAAGILCNPRGKNWHYKNLRVTLLGRHQAENTATALAAIDILREKGYFITEKNVRQALGHLSWPARMEVLGTEPVLLLDVAHNPDGARVLGEAVKSHFPGRRVIMVFGALSDKDVKSMASILGPLCEVVILTRPDSPRALEPKAALPLFQDQVPVVLVEEGIGKALELARQNARATDLILVCGSFYMVGAARECIV